MGGRSPLSSCGRHSALPPPVARFTNRSFYNINIGDLPTPVWVRTAIPTPAILVERVS